MFRRLPLGSEGPIRMDAYELLPRFGKSLTMAAAEPYQVLRAGNVTVGERESYTAVPLGESLETTVRDFFAGLILNPGGEARRELSAINEDDLADVEGLAQQQRNFASYAERMLDDPRHAAQLIGQTADIVGAAPDDQAALQLQNLANEYRMRGDWENAEAVLVELTERYPHEPPAIEAMAWLLRFWSSAEVSWQRLRDTTSVEKSRMEPGSPEQPARLLQAIDTSPRSDIQQTSASGQVIIDGKTDQNAARLEQWQQGAARMLELLEEHAANDVNGSANQFVLASMHRKSESSAAGR